MWSGLTIYYLADEVYHNGNELRLIIEAGVIKSTYNSYNKTDQVKIVVGRGRFGVPWVEVN